MEYYIHFEQNCNLGNAKYRNIQCLFLLVKYTAEKTPSKRSLRVDGGYPMSFL